MTRFGPGQMARYADLIEKAAGMVAEFSHRPDSRARDDISSGVRAIHIGLVGSRRAAASHVLFYIPEKTLEKAEGVVILRLLHERMDHLRHGVADTVG